MISESASELAIQTDTVPKLKRKSTKTKTKKPDHFDPTPARDAVTVFDKRMQSVTMNFRNDKPVKSNRYQNLRNLRQDSRTKGKKGFQRIIYSYKMVTNGDVIWSAQKQTENYFTASPELTYRDGAFSFASPFPTAPPPPTPTENDDVDNLNKTPVDTPAIDFQTEKLNFAELAHKSPSKSRRRNRQH